MSFLYTDRALIIALGVFACEIRLTLDLLPWCFFGEAFAVSDSAVFAVTSGLDALASAGTRSPAPNQCPEVSLRVPRQQ